MNRAVLSPNCAVAIRLPPRESERFTTPSTANAHFASGAIDAASTAFNTPFLSSHDFERSSKSMQIDTKIKKRLLTSTGIIERLLSGEDYLLWRFRWTTFRLILTARNAATNLSIR